MPCGRSPPLKNKLKQMRMKKEKTNREAKKLLKQYNSKPKKKVKMK
jgi:hypothetical protein